MLSVKYGPFQPALEQAFLEELEALKAEDPWAPVAVVTPARRLADRLERLVAAEAGKAYAGVAFHTFYSLALETVGEAGVLDRALVRSPLFFDRLLDSLLGLGPASPRGLAGAYRSTLKDLLDAGVEPRALELAEEGLLADGAAAERLKELLRLLARYEAALAERGVLAPAGLARLAAQAAEGSAALARYRAVLYYGFYDLTGAQCELFEAVARERPTTLFFPYRKDRPAFAFADRFFKTKLHLGGRSPRPLPDEPRGRALGPALDALFTPGAAGSVEAGRLRVFSASGERDEAWRVAKEILRLAEAEGLSFSDVGVVARTLEPYRAPIAEAFEESAVPFHTSAAEPLLRSPAARAAWTLLSLARRDFPALAVLDLAGSPFFRGGAPAGWRPLVERLRVHRGWLQWEGKLSAAAGRDFELYPQLAAEGRPGLVVPGAESMALWRLLQDLKLRLTPPGRRAWSAWADHARTLLADVLDASGDPAFSGVLSCLEELRTLDLNREEVSFEEFLDALEEALKAAKAPSRPDAHLGVRVLDAMEARGESFKVLFLVGLQEGVFPRTIREDPLLRDAARRALSDTGGYWISEKQAGHEEEKLLFWLTAASASDRLYCSYPRSDENGRARIPSAFLLELCRAAGVSLGASSEHVPRQPAARLSQEELSPYLSPKEASIAGALCGFDNAALHRAFADAGFDGEAWRRLSARARDLNRPGPPGPMDGIIGPPEEMLARLRLKGLSPSALETLARCPFQFYASRALGLGEPDEPSERGEIAPAVKGEIYHRVLKAFYDLLPGSFFDDKSAPFPEAALAAAEGQVFAAYGWRELGVYPLLWEIAREAMGRNLRRFLARDLEELRREGWRPFLREAELSGVLGVPLPRALSGAPFMGRADRVDVASGRFRVVDYKTKLRKGRIEKAALEGKNLQAPLYLELAAGDPRLKGLKPGGARFCALEDPPEGPEATREYAAEAHAGQRLRVLAVVGSLAAAAAAGRFAISAGEHCAWCSFSRLCRRSHPMTLARSRAASGGA